MCGRVQALCASSLWFPALGASSQTLLTALSASSLSFDVRSALDASMVFTSISALRFKCFYFQRFALHGLRCEAGQIQQALFTNFSWLSKCQLQIPEWIRKACQISEAVIIAIESAASKATLSPAAGSASFHIPTAAATSSEFLDQVLRWLNSPFCLRLLCFDLLWAAFAGAHLLDWARLHLFFFFLANCRKLSVRLVSVRFWVE